MLEPPLTVVSVHFASNSSSGAITAITALQEIALGNCSETLFIIVYEIYVASDFIKSNCVFK